MSSTKSQKAMIVNKRKRGIKPNEPFCLAPTTGLYFNADGSIGVCCYNRKNIFGRYPEVSVHQAWASSVRKKMVDAFGEHQFPEGCIRCEGEVCKSPLVSTLATRFDAQLDTFRQASELMDRAPYLGLKTEQLPLTVELELGTICNLECQMCNGWVSSAIRKNREGLPPLKNPYDEAFVEQLRPFVPYFRDVKFLGGEPFLNHLNFKVWDLLIESKQTTSVSITTNATHLTKQAKKVLKQLKPWVTVSLDSLDPENFQRIRKNADYKAVMKNVDWLIRHKHMRGIAACVMPNNWQDMPELVSFCNRHGLKIWFNTVFEPHEHSMASLTKHQLTEAWFHLKTTKIATKFGKAHQPIVEENMRVYDSLIHQLLGLMGFPAQRRPK